MICQTKDCNKDAIYAKDSYKYTVEFNFTFDYYCEECYKDTVVHNVK